MRKFFTKLKSKVTLTYKKTSQKILSYIDRHPLRSFFIALGVVLGLIVLGSFIPTPQQPELTTDTIKRVSLYRIGQAPKVSVSAQIRKSGVIQIVAQVPGIVNFIHAFEGTKVRKGSPLVNIASNYQGRNTASVSRQIAQQQNNSVQTTYPIQKELISKQRELAQKNNENIDQLREIASQSNSETRNLISLNEQILATINEDLATLEQNPSANRNLILSTRQLKSQFEAATNQARAALRNSEQQTSEDKAPSQIADLNKEITLQQLDIQEKQLDINREISHLQLALAQINEATYFPVAPFAGTVERVFVNPFEAVNPGTPLMILSQNMEDDPITAIAYVSHEIAQNVSQLEPSILHIGGQELSVTPSFISNEAVQGSLYAIYYPLPDSLSPELVNNGFITVDIPVGYPDTSFAASFVPIDAIYQTQTTTYVFVKEGEFARSKEVALGQIFGRFVAIQSGISLADDIILDRTVIDGDKVEGINE